MIRIVTKATSANLGPGFDVLGLSLDKNNVFLIKKDESYHFKGFEETYASKENNLFVKSYLKALKELNKKEIPLSIEILSDIPVSRGLGSSSSLIVGGIQAAYAVYDLEADKKEVLRIATEIEGHPDNVAPCIYGGLCASLLEKDEILTSFYEVNDSLQFLFLSPDYELSTAKARAALPEKISHKEAVINGRNLLFLLKGLKEGSEELLKIAIKDYLHTPYRKSLINEYDEVNEILKNSGVIASTISGAGPTVLGIYKNLNKEKLTSELKKLKNSWTLYCLNIDLKGSYYEQISDC